MAESKSAQQVREITDKPGVEFLFRKGAYVCF